MSFENSITPDPRACRRCSRELLPGALVCEHCLALVYSEQLDQLAAEARKLEAHGDLSRARETWLKGIRLLPSMSKQAQWIQEHASSLEGATATAAGGIATSVVAREESLWRRGFLRLLAFGSFVAFAAVYSNASGAKFGVGFASLILIHEMGHYVDIRRRGLPADMPIFLPGLGAYVRWRALGVSLPTRAAISLAGPLAGSLAAVACAGLWWQTHDSFWLVLARVGAALNLLNLIPIWILDGGQAALALSRGERIGLTITSVLLWIVLRDNLLILVAAGAFIRAFFARDVPSSPSPGIATYFIAVVTALAVILHLLPGHGFGMR